MCGRSEVLPEPFAGRPRLGLSGCINLAIFLTRLLLDVSIEPGPAGAQLLEVIVLTVDEHLANDVTIIDVAPLAKFTTAILTAAPPAVVPDFGVTELTVGAPAGGGVVYFDRMVLSFFRAPGDEFR